MTGEVENRITIFCLKQGIQVVLNLLKNSCVKKKFSSKLQNNIFPVKLAQYASACIFDAPATANKLTTHVIRLSATINTMICIIIDSNQSQYWTNNLLKQWFVWIRWLVVVGCSSACSSSCSSIRLAVGFKQLF